VRLRVYPTHFRQLYSAIEIEVTGVTDVYDAQVAKLAASKLPSFTDSPIFRSSIRPSSPVCSFNPRRCNARALRPIVQDYGIQPGRTRANNFNDAFSDKASGNANRTPELNSSRRHSVYIRYASNATRLAFNFPQSALICTQPPVRIRRGLLLGLACMNRLNRALR